MFAVLESGGVVDCRLIVVQELGVVVAFKADQPGGRAVFVLGYLQEVAIVFAGWGKGDQALRVLKLLPFLSHFLFGLIPL